MGGPEIKCKVSFKKREGISCWHLAGKAEKEQRGNGSSDQEGRGEVAAGVGELRGALLDDTKQNALTGAS